MFAAPFPVSGPGLGVSGAYYRNSGAGNNYLKMFTGNTQ
jgi:hypothetical protein